MASQRTSRYDAAEIMRRFPPEPSELFRGFVAWAEDVGKSRRSVRETLAETPGRVLRRTVWDDLEERDRRLAVDVVECATAREAVVALLDRLEWNQLSALPEGPSDLGVAAFMHPEGVPPAVFFARANLCISVVSFARRPAAVLPVAHRIDRRLTAPTPAVGPRLQIEKAEAREGIGLTVRLPFPLAEDGYLRYETVGGSLEIRGDDIVVLPRALKEVRVRVFAIEPGREPAVGTLEIALD